MTPFLPYITDADGNPRPEVRFHVGALALYPERLEQLGGWILVHRPGRDLEYLIVAEEADGEVFVGRLIADSEDEIAEMERDELYPCPDPLTIGIHA